MEHAATPSRLAFRQPDPGPGAPAPQAQVLLVHGFAQTSRCLGPLADRLAERHEVAAVDAPGHGGSVEHAAADLWEGSELLIRGHRPSVLVGYSMGARFAFHAALRPDAGLDALVLISATAGIEDEVERERRRATDEERAQRLEHVGLRAFLDEWLAMPMFSQLPTWARFDEERRANTVEGLAASLRQAGTGSMTPLWDRLGEITCPVLLITGEQDATYTALAERIGAALGGPCRRVVVPGAGHATHLEAPDVVTDAVLALLDSTT